MTEASSHFAVAALNVLAMVMVADGIKRGPWRTSGIWINGVFALVNAAHGFQKVMA